MFEITKAHISLLSDTDLRIMVGLLCEAELRRRNLPPISVTYGGHQDAADGGLDVRVSLEPGAHIALPIPRPISGYQVKAEPMGPAAITGEMKPKGQLREIFRELADAGGAYIIASSKSSVADVALSNRIRAMKDAVAELPNASALHLHFFDSTRLATWVRDHPGMLIWVREKIGQPLRQWKPYEQWTSSTEGEAFLVDEGLRFVSPKAQDNSPVSIADGFDEIRATLATPKGVVRFVGLSGVGKTRIAQALFESGVAGAPLDQSLAVYTNLGASTDPSPVDLATELNAIGQRAILVIDNCPSDTHAELSDICRKPSSQLSLLSIEYDIRDDQPEGTDVYEIQPTSDEIIQKLIAVRFPTLSTLDAQRAAEFSGGNARIAIAIASTVKEGEAIYELSDDNLFRRLFDQRKGSNDSLLQSAQVCSLVYSFNVEDAIEGDDAELRRLGAVIGRDFDTLHRDVDLLRQRDLVQQRGAWRAVLPHAVANRLARFAFTEIPAYRIGEFIKTASPRLLQSFSRRMGYLHESQQVTKIVADWFAPNGALGNIGTLNDFEIEMFKNVAPVDSEGALAAIERAIAGISDVQTAKLCAPFRELLWSLAYEDVHFARSTEVLIRVAAADSEGKSSKQKRDGISGLFTIFLSGTHATINQRAKLVENLITHSDDRRRAIGKETLDALLQTGHFVSFHNFNFGARRRDYGYAPKTNEEILAWYRTILHMCVKIDGTGGWGRREVRSSLAEKLPSLWHSLELQDEISAACVKMSVQEYWPDGWLAVCSIRRWQKKEFTPEERVQVDRLEKSLRPVSLYDRADAFLKQNAGSGYWDAIDEDDDERDYSKQLARTQEAAYALGKEIPHDTTLLTKVAKALVSSQAQMVFGSMAKGIVEASVDPRTTWAVFVLAFTETNRDQRQGELLASLLLFLKEHDALFVQNVLDSAVEDSVLGEWLPVLQARVGFDRSGVARIKKALRFGAAPIGRYLSISYANKRMSHKSLRSIVGFIAKKPDGFEVALQLAWMVITCATRDKQTLSEDIVSAGRDLLKRINWKNKGHMDDYHLAEVAVACLRGLDGEALTKKICVSFLAATNKFTTGLYEHGRLFSALASIHPSIILDSLLLSKPAGNIRRIRSRFEEVSGNVFGSITEAKIIEWCDQDPTIRYPLMATAIVAFSEPGQGGKQQWTPLALTLLGNAPEPIEVLRLYTDQFYPMSWRGSRAAVMEANVKLLDDIQGDAKLDVFVEQERGRLTLEIEQIRRSELGRYRLRDERFE